MTQNASGQPEGTPELLNCNKLGDCPWDHQEFGTGS